MHTNSEPASALRTIGRAETVRLAVVVGALGVVFGDIGTSPIYTIQTVFNPDDPHPVPVSTDNVYGVVSLIFWSVMIIVTLTYVAAGDARRQRRRGRHHGADHAAAAAGARRGAGGPRSVLAALGIFGAALFFGDSMITPAISVLSAVEGLKVVEPSLERLDRPDHRGDHRGAVRGAAPRHRRRRPAVRAGDDRLVRWRSAPAASPASPTTRRSSGRCRRPTRVGFLVGHFDIAFFALAAVVLAVTGAEALYADMGHFGRRAITRGWLVLVLPGLHAQLPRPGRADPRRPEQRSAARSSCSCPTGRGCRWCCWPPRRP